MSGSNLRIELWSIAMIADQELRACGVKKKGDGHGLADTLIDIKEAANTALQEDAEPDTTAEVAYRRGWQQGLVSAEDILLPLMEQGFTPQEIKLLFAAYNDHFVAPWRSGDHEKFEVPPGFSVPKIMDTLYRIERERNNRLPELN
jgi:hypothetical protein